LFVHSFIGFGCCAIKCGHCHRVKPKRPRGLCCWFSSPPGGRDFFPPTRKSARRGVGNGNVVVPLPATPTTAAPGSPEKVAILEQRARLGVSLWHPADAPMDAESFVLGVR